MVRAARSSSAAYAATAGSRTIPDAFIVRHPEELPGP
jgi:hypothetical protein